MARPSNRQTILEAAVRVAARDPITTVTIDAVATEAGLTKAGVLYHFPSKNQLLVAVQEHLAVEWETQLIAAAGGTAEETPLPRRVAAYARVSAESASRAELVLMIEATAAPEIAAPMRTVIDRWVPSVDAALRDPELWPYVLARLAADGLWVGDTDKDLPAEERVRIAAAIAAIAEPDGPGPGA
jgi:AcrR family transcriptional regulator